MNIIFDMFTHFIYDHIISYIHFTPVITIGVFWGGGGEGGCAPPQYLTSTPSIIFSTPQYFSITHIKDIFLQFLT